MFRISRPLAADIHAVLNASVTLLVLVAALAGAIGSRLPNGFSGLLAQPVTVGRLLVITLFLAGYALAFHEFGLGKAGAEPAWREILRVIAACITASLAPLLLLFTLEAGEFAGNVALYCLPVLILACACGRLAARAFAGPLTRALGGRRELIVVGSGPRASAISERLTRGSDARVLGFVDSPNGHPVPAAIRRQMLGGLDQLESILMNRSVDEVVIALPVKSCYDQIQSAIQTCERMGVEAKYPPDVFQLSLARPRLETSESASLVSLDVVHNDNRLIVKRAIDIAGAIVGLVLLGPLLLAIAAAIRLTSQGPALFAQERYGAHKRRFRMYKFRTMLLDAEKLQAELESSNEAQGPVFKIRSDPRITRVGRFLRRTSLDELPQLFNVLKGEMALVGPRPLPVRDVARFGDPSLMRRFSVMPGMTCLWQISGRSDTTFDRWIELDLQYIDNWSLRMDLSILARTFPAIVRGTGAA